MDLLRMEGTRKWGAACGGWPWGVWASRGPPRSPGGHSLGPLGLQDPRGAGQHLLKVGWVVLPDAARPQGPLGSVLILNRLGASPGAPEAGQGGVLQPGWTVGSPGLCRAGCPPFTPGLASALSAPPSALGHTCFSAAVGSLPAGSWSGLVKRWYHGD